MPKANNQKEERRGQASLLGEGLVLHASSYLCPFLPVHSLQFTARENQGNYTEWLPLPAPTPLYLDRVLFYF